MSDEAVGEGGLPIDDLLRLGMANNGAVFGPTDPAVYGPLGPAVTILHSHASDFAEAPSENMQQQICEILLG